MENDDMLAELEARILKYYLAKGYKLFKNQKEGDPKWEFLVSILSSYKDKKLSFYFRCSDPQKDENFVFDGKTTKEMFDKAFQYFTIPYQMPCPYGFDGAEEQKDNKDV